MRALDRDHVAGLLDDAYQPAVATLVEADRAARALREVEADLAQRDLLLDVADRVRERVRVLRGGAQDVERQPLRRAVRSAAGRAPGEPAHPAATAEAAEHVERAHGVEPAGGLRAAHRLL